MKVWRHEVLSECTCQPESCLLVTHHQQQERAYKVHALAVTDDAAQIRLFQGKNLLFLLKNLHFKYKI